jgi:cation/acetate symporter
MMLLVLAILAATVAVGGLAGTGRLSDFYAGGALSHPALNGLAIAVSAMPGALFLAVPGTVPPGGRADLAIFIGIAAGLLLAVLLLMPPLRKFAGYTLPDFLAERFQGGDARTVGIVAVLFCSLPLLVAGLWAAGLVVAHAVGTDASRGIVLVGAAILLAHLAGGLRSSSPTLALQGAVLVIAVAAAALFADRSGAAAAGAIGIVVSENAEGWTALALTLALGTASLPPLLMRAITFPSGRVARLSYAWGVAALVPLFFAPLAFRIGFALAEGQGSSSTLGFAGACAGVALLAAGLAAASGFALVVANLLSYDIYYKSLDPSAASPRRLGVARACLALVVASATWLATRIDADAARLAAWSFSLAASGLLPVLALGLWWPRANRQGAIAGIAVGLGLCLYYFLAPRFIPISFYETSSFLSNATPDDVAGYLKLKQAYLAAGEGDKAAALAALEDKARALGNWGGVPTACAALFAVPAGFLVTIIVSLLTPPPPEDVQRFVAALREPLKERG